MCAPPSWSAGWSCSASCSAYVQEHRSSKAVEKLQAMVQTNCLVMRDGNGMRPAPWPRSSPETSWSCNAGAIIPADLRLITAKDFFVGQSSLTGESMPVEKTRRS